MRAKPTTSKHCGMKSFHIDDRLLAAIKRAASERGVSESTVIRDAVAKFVGVCPTCGMHAEGASDGDGHRRHAKRSAA